VSVEAKEKIQKKNQKDYLTLGILKVRVLRPTILSKAQFSKVTTYSYLFLK
jgi:hypothetical protein